MAETKEIYVQSMVASKMLEPAVMLRLGEEFTNMPPDVARKVAGDLVGCAEAAEQDAFLMSFFEQRIGLSREEAGQILMQFREARAEGNGGA